MEKQYLIKKRIGTEKHRWTGCFYRYQRRIQGGGGWGMGGGDGWCAPFFAITYFFCNRFEELQTVLFEVELIINNASLTYVYPNTCET